MFAPIKNEHEFVQCLTALLKFESEVERRFMIMPEDMIYQQTMNLRRLVRDYLNKDKRLDG